MTETEYQQRNRFKLYVIILPYLIFAFIVAAVVIVSPKTIWFVTLFGVFMVYHVIAMFVAFLFKYGKETLYLLFLTGCMVAAFAFFVNMLLEHH
ncbi:hypothetical protein [Staphylococcus sp. 17KM0847]|uniref:hypothetical protein n=1 Tax=Staphylococcus sp. 17KM0847 TaxID=2583989 RepID=UPI0015DC5A6B|nr:hypothetical protein [Staphylococcus sp. 17KM0847]QLK85474.1 hypothetical protein FGL66_01520 [Staphylococcus sp. 17KM0847]